MCERSPHGQNKTARQKEEECNDRLHSCPPTSGLLVLIHQREEFSHPLGRAGIAHELIKQRAFAKLIRKRVFQLFPSTANSR